MSLYSQRVFALLDRDFTHHERIEFALSAPISQEQRCSDDWRATSICWKVLLELNGRFKKGGLSNAQKLEFNALVPFWMEHFLSLPPRLLGRLRTLFFAQMNMQKVVPFIDSTDLNDCAFLDSTSNILDFPIQIIPSHIAVDDAQLSCQSRMIMIHKLNAASRGELTLSFADLHKVKEMNRIFSHHGYQTIDIDLSQF